MKIKTKLTLWVGLLFALIILLTVVSTVYVNALKKDTNNILTANYNTLEYSRNMILALDEMKSNPDAIEEFETSLKKQRLNETEPGEKEATDKVSKHFDEVKNNPDDTLSKPLIRKDISELMRLNMVAIEKKSEIASHTAQTATVWISITGTICFLVAFILLINLPGDIANPIKELTQSIHEIAAQNYDQRVHFSGRSEFGELANSFNTMAEKLEEYAGSGLANLLMEKKRIEALINNMHDPVIGLDEAGKILFANDETLKISGLKKEEVIGEDVHKVAAANDLVRMLIKDMQNDARGQKKEPIKIYADNKESYFEKEIMDITVIPTGEAKSKDIGKVIILRNVTIFKELDYAKTNFIATVSHELKTPISSIQMSIQLLRHTHTGDLNPEQIQLLDSINEDSGRLLKITGELLKMTQVETGNIQLNIQPAEASSIVKLAMDATRTQAEQRKIVIQLELPEFLPQIQSDTEKTAWVLTNFITNAIRYSPKNTQIIVGVENREDSLYFYVQDFGSGIEEKYWDKVFDRYFQVPGSSKSGSGLGLAISKDFIEAQGGFAGLKSEEGAGSTFYFYLPKKDNKILPGRNLS